MVGVKRCYEVQGDSILEALNAVVGLCPGLGVHLFDESGALRRLLLCAKNGEIVNPNEISDSTLVDADEILLFASIAGG